MAVITHPHVIRHATIFANSLVIDRDSPRLISLLGRLLQSGWKGDVSHAENVPVERPCPYTLFKGEHVQHRTFTRDSCDPQTTHVYRFPCAASRRQVLDWLDENGINYERTYCQHDYDCCGRWYCDGPYFNYRPGRTIVSIGWYMNV